MSREEKLTVDIIKAMVPPVKGRAYIRDSDAKGLRITITKGGHRAWYWVGRARGEASWIKIGDFPGIPIARARQEAARINGDVAEGRRPATRAKKKSEEMTLGQLHTWYMENVSKPHKETWKRDEKKLDRYWSDFRHFGLSEITKSDVTQQHVAIGKTRGKVAANDAVRFLSSLYWAATNNLNFEGVNPTRGVRRFKTQSRERFLSPDELRQFFEAVENLKNKDARDILLLCLITGARRGSVSSMRWKDIDETKMVWTIPGTVAKKRKPLSVVLIPEALEIIKARKNLSAFVFHSARAKSGHYTWPKNSWKKLCEDAGFTDVVIHDLRRTFASYQASLNVSLLTIAKSIGHGGIESTEVYARLQLDPVREAVHKATAVMLEMRKELGAVKSKKTGKLAQGGGKSPQGSARERKKK